MSAWVKEKNEALRVLQLAFDAGAFEGQLVNRIPHLNKLQAKRVTEDFLHGQYPMLVPCVAVVSDMWGYNRFIAMRKRKHWRRYARRHGINPNTGRRR